MCIRDRVEGALDDIQLWNGALNTTDIEDQQEMVLTLYPSPANDALNVVLATNELKGLRLEVYDMTGRKVLSPSVANASPGQPQQLDIRTLAEGNYLLRVIWQGGSNERRFNVMR